MNDYEKDRRAEQIAYLQHCVSENLNHARHVENERLTFTSIYIAMVIGAVAVVFGLDNQRIAAVVALFLVVFALLSALLNMRWQGVFDDHIHMAETCQKAWRDALDGEKPPELPEMGYFYGNYHKTAGLANAFRRLCGASVWELNRSAEEVDEARKKRKKANDTAARKIGWFFKELGRTRRQFALLYLIALVVLILLFLYLCFTEDYGGFYFTEEVISRLEESIGRIVEENQQ